MIGRFCAPTFSRMKKRLFGTALGAWTTSILLSFAGPAAAVDGISFEAGSGSVSTDAWRAGLQWRWDRRWFEDRAWSLGGYWELQLGQWSAPAGTITDVSLTPVFRLEPSRAPGQASGHSYYIEAAIGFHLLSGRRVSSRRKFSTRFQFGDHVGVGVRFGERRRHDLGVRLQHLSNANIDTPNPGINFVLLRYQLHLD